MKLYDACIRGFIMGNLGDDLFIDILCNRYPDKKFVLCGNKQYKHCFTDIQNLTYISYDSFLLKTLFRILKTPAWCINKFCSVIGASKRVSYFGCEQFFQRISKENILISGSIFMEMENSEFVIGPYQISEKKYYKLKPNIIGCNFGPYYNDEYLQFYQSCFKEAKWVCFRERYSYDLFKGENIAWGTDIVFSYNKNKICIPDKKDYIAVSILNLNKDTGGNSQEADDFIQNIANAVNLLLNRGEHIILVGFCNAQGDNRINEEIYKKCNKNENITVFNYPTVNYKEMIGILANSKAIISTRYHGMILGWLLDKKVLPIIYSKKMKNVIDDIDPEIICCNLLEEQLSGEGLIGAYDKMMNSPMRIDVEKLINKSQIHFKYLDNQFG